MRKTILFGFHKADEPNSPFYNRIIAWWTNGPYCHVEIFFKDDDRLLKKFSSSPEDGCVRVKPTSFYVEGYDYIPYELTENEFKILKDYINELKGGKYDWAGILGFILPTKDRSNEWFCSETTSNYLKILGFKGMWKIEPSEVSPNKLADILKDTGHPVLGLSFKYPYAEKLEDKLRKLLEFPTETVDHDYDKTTFWDLFKKKKRKKNENCGD